MRIPRRRQPWQQRIRGALRHARLRLVRWGKAQFPPFLRWRNRAMRAVPGYLHWLRSVFLFPVWISFEVYIGVWEKLERRASQHHDVHLRHWHRLLFCLTLSLLVTQPTFLLVSQIHMSNMTMLLVLMHGTAIHFFWKRGARWFRHMLGVRPARSVDPAHPFAGLDL